MEVYCVKKDHGRRECWLVNGNERLPLTDLMVNDRLGAGVLEWGTERIGSVRLAYAILKLLTGDADLAEALQVKFATQQIMKNTGNSLVWRQDALCDWVAERLHEWLDVLDTIDPDEQVVVK